MEKSSQQSPGNKPVFVTQPFLPPLEEFMPYLQDIWDRKVLTNNGHYHQQLEKALCEYLGVQHISVFSNGTLGLITALQALRITGEVITTPYSFVATAHSLWWNNIKPVFVDIEPDWFNIDPAKIEAAITPRTTAIMPVHVYGNPCNVLEIERIAKAYGLKVIYDACHTFGVTINGNSVLNFGDLSVMSFHATKVYNTFEGGAIVCHSAEMKQHIDHLKNFGFTGETSVIAPGINAKMNEVQAAMGMLQLKYADEVRERRSRVVAQYRDLLSGIPGIATRGDMEGVRHCYSYFPILVDHKKFGAARDTVYDALKANGIMPRRYFYPLITSFSTYRSMPSAAVENLPVANTVADQVLCLPLYPDLDSETVDRICAIIRSAGGR